jgi:hypothetical protein
MRLAPDKNDDDTLIVILLRSVLSHVRIKYCERVYVVVDLNGKLPLFKKRAWESIIINEKLLFLNVRC